MAKQSADAARSGELKILPPEFKQVWYKWLDNIRDWCISRQLWWGHRVPAFFVEKKDAGAESGFAPAYPAKEGDDATMDMRNWVAASSDEEALAAAAKKTGVAAAELRVSQDPDVLDTWFSSGLLPFTAFGWPDEKWVFGAGAGAGGGGGDVAAAAALLLVRLVLVPTLRADPHPHYPYYQARRL